MDESKEFEVLTVVKKEINNLLWMHGDSKMTIEEAERRAVVMWDVFQGRSVDYSPVI